MNRRALNLEIGGSYVAAVLAATPVFSVLEPEALEAACIELCEGNAWQRNRCIGRQRLTAGTTVFEQGAFADALYVVESGELEVLVAMQPTGRQAHIALLHPGDLFGEAVVAQERQRTGTVRALTDCVLLAVHEDAVNELLRQFPALSTAFLRLMIARLPGLERIARSGARWIY